MKLKQKLSLDLRRLECLPLGFRDDVRCHVLFEDAVSDQYQLVQLTEENPRKSWAAIDGHPDGACSSGRGSWNSGVGTGVARPHDARRTVRALLGRLLEEAAGSGAQTTTMKTITLRAGLKRPRVGARERANEVRQKVVQ